jgi:hypothetical protein
MRARDRLGNFLAFLFWMVVVMPGAIKAQKAAESKVDPPRAGINGVTSPICIYGPLPGNREVPQGEDFRRVA